MAYSRTTFASLEEGCQSLFDWNPPVLLPSTKGKRHNVSLEDEGAPQKRLSDFYDRHISDDLVLKHVVHAKDLHRRMAFEADRALQRRVSDDDKILPTWQYFRASAREAQIDGRYEPLVDSASLQKYYEETTALFCLPAVTALYFRSPRWIRILEWGAREFPVEPPICAPSLRLYDSIGVEAPVVGPAGSPPDYIDGDAKQLVIDSTAVSRDIATWEVKSLFEGTKDVLLAIQRESSANAKTPFVWDRGSAEIKYDRLGNSMTRLRASEDVLKHDSPETLSWLTDPWDDPFRRAWEHTSSEASGSSVADGRDSLDRCFERGGSSLQAVNDMDSNLWKGVDETERRKRDPARPPVDLHLAGNHMLQQAWAQSVRQKTTVLILHCGNFEFVGVRHRSTQTLYISDLLHVPGLSKPGYGHLQMGIYMTAIEDLFRRTVDLRDMYSKRERDEDDPDETDDPDVSPFIRRMTAPDRAEPFGNEREPVPSRFTQDWAIQEIRRRESLVMSIRYGIYDSTRPSIFTRFAAGQRNVLKSSTRPAIGDRLDLVLYSLIERGATGLVHSGVLRLERDGRTAQAKVVAKLAFNEDQQRDLAKESELYEHLASKGVTGIPVCYGHFSFDDATEPSCLLLSFAGETLNGRYVEVSRAQKNRFFEILRDIHAAGILHKDIRPLNLMIGEDGEPVIIDFGHAQTESSDNDRRRELRKLKRLLDDYPEPAPVQDEGKAKKTARSRTARGVRVVSEPALPPQRKRAKVTSVPPPPPARRNPPRAAKRTEPYTRFY